jgi:hypothetical protein
MKINLFFSFIFCTVLTNQGCDDTVKKSTPTDHGPFGEYWYQGKGEVNTYFLEQERYKEIRKGEAVMVFVTEDFSMKKQVKLDYPEQAGADKVTVMKNNALRRFQTGIYDYSLMESVFTPVDITHFPHSLKADASVQDWCGQVFTQLNLKGSGYEVNSYSYFEKEGDQHFRTENALLEDELFNLIRINPEKLPVGEVTILPSLFYTRLHHQPLKPQSAKLTIEDIGLQRVCILRYSSMNRTLKITFQKDFPYRINAWEEDNGDGFITRAKLNKSIQTAYWEKNSHQYDSWRDTLGL